jgi:hypothetical protein
MTAVSCHKQIIRKGRMNMKTTWRIGLLFFFMTILGIGIHLRGGQLVIEPVAKAAARQDESFSFACSPQTIKGSYGISTTGSIVSAGPVGPVADVGVITFDGNGAVSQTTTISLNGGIIVPLAGTQRVVEVHAGENRNDCKTKDSILRLVLGWLRKHSQYDDRIKVRRYLTGTKGTGGGRSVSQSTERLLVAGMPSQVSAIWRPP